MSEIGVSSQEIKMGAIVLVLSLLFVFAGGYFLGKKRALEEIALHYEDECFADKVQQSLSLFGDQPELPITEFATSDTVLEALRDQEK